MELILSSFIAIIPGVIFVAYIKLYDRFRASRISAGDIFVSGGSAVQVIDVNGVKIRYKWINHVREKEDTCDVDAFLFCWKRP
jgi:hypothetical protein